MAPPVVASSMSLWLDANDLQDATIPLQGEAITQWTDKSGNNRHFTAAGIARPMRMDKSSPSGLSVVRFDGANNVLQSAATWADISNAGVYTLFMVACVTGKASADTTNLMNNDLLFGSGATNYSGLNVKDNVNTADFIAYNWDGTADTVIINGSYNNFYIIQSDHSATTLNLRLNGGAASSIASGAISNMTFPLKIGVVGGTNFACMEVCEVIAYPAVLSTADRQAIEAYLTTRWLTPPGTPLSNTKLHFFRDTFKTFDTTKYPQTANARIVDDRLTHSATTTTVSTSAWWTSQYDLTDSFMYCRAWPDKGGPQRWCGMYVMKDPQNYVYWFSFGTTSLYARKTQAGIVTEVGNIVYDPVQHAYWRIEYSGGNILFRTAPDPVDGSGHVWTTRFTTTVPNWPLHLVKPHFQTSDLDLISCIAQYDNLNVRPATQHTLTLTDDELIAAGFVEGSNTLKAFVMDESGNWST